MNYQRAGGYPPARYVILKTLYAYEGNDNLQKSSVKLGAFNKTPAAGWYTDILNAAGLVKVNKAGLTQLRLYFATDDNNNRLADYMKFVSGNSLTNKPVLVITYSLP